MNAGDELHPVDWGEVAGFRCSRASLAGLAPCRRIYAPRPLTRAERFERAVLRVLLLFAATNLALAIAFFVWTGWVGGVVFGSFAVIDAGMVVLWRWRFPS